MSEIFLGIPRFDKFIKKDEEKGCWLWTGNCNWGGYSKYWHDYKTIAGHRYSYTHAKGEIPPGLTIDHLCRVRNCVNPNHLEVVTMKENLKRALNTLDKRTHCNHGHIFDEANSRIVRTGGRTYRTCRACGNLRAREFAYRKKLQKPIRKTRSYYIMEMVKEQPNKIFSYAEIGVRLGLESKIISCMISHDIDKLISQGLIEKEIIGRKSFIKIKTLC